MKMRRTGLRTRDILIRADIDFKRELDNIIKERIVRGKEKPTRHNGTRRITQAIRRHSKWNEIKLDIISADLE
jgi:hypothetical protein